MSEIGRKIELGRREKELLDRIEKMKKTMNETKELGTLERLSQLLKEAKQELIRIQEKMEETGGHQDSG